MSKKIERKPMMSESELPLGFANYKLMLIGIGVIILGFILMAGSENIYDFRKMYLAPVLVTGGFIFEIYAIMKRPKDKE